MRAYGLLLSLLLSVGAVQAAPDPATTERELKAVKQQISQLQKTLAKRQQRLEAAERELKQHDKRIGEVKARLQALGEEQQTLQSRRSELGKNEDQLLAVLQARESQIRELLREQYRLGRQPALKLLLSQEDPQSVSRMLRYYDHLTDALNAELKGYRQALAELTETQSSIAETDSSLLSTREQLEARRQELADARAAQAKTLARLRQQQSSDRGRLGQLEQDQVELAAVLKEIRRSLEEVRLQQDGLKFHQRKGKLSWPVKGRIKRAFGAQVENVAYEGLLIDASAGTEVKAVHHGRVVFADWLRGYGLVLILDHGGGYLSLYGHNDSLLREPGEWVGTGETLALAGSSGGSTEPGLYFAIRYKGRSTDPIVWLERR
ncbi:peptidoglycan DD-metalloendopeptidase family protein [Marinobacterium sp. AK62]|uniref:Peptidoglycan DD-metalloendopeptidase family protein n=1 Tax=Marinobacterium alkalitolerans TaxID=1542925 RepID=A0ABS3Z5X2_9GAMM|nr:peptidoglycan DD-metalloendopeptidase family protein [Marinobacterium alkalitolerans]MBP0047106.1 peptidoglycan DD-metalloendopeptidase family protein [Marinobacterium alkalitolerans]